MEGGNLSLQVHPDANYMRETFAINYTQDETYYILDCQNEGSVFLGLKDNINKEDMINDLRAAQRGEIIFPDEKYVNNFKVKKHDHLMIPGGTVHCSSKDTMVLEISAAPSIFTFKMWDWGRVGLDGIPRPTHIDHAIKNIQWDKGSKWIEETCTNLVKVIHEEEGNREEETGCHEFQFFKTIRNWFSNPVIHRTNGEFVVFNLVEGIEAIVESPLNEFEPMVIHYAETFIIPAQVKEISIRPYGKSEGKTIATVKAFVKF
jgi:mannose-6-phosphate isomerase class I